MGVLNVTPDSFSDGGRHCGVDAALSHALRLLDEGADLIDVGGESTRPGAEPVPEAEEIQRVVPVITRLAAERPGALISVDTRRAGTGRAALEAGAVVLNDVSGGRDDPGMFPLAAETGAGLVIMHMRGEPRTMQDDPRYEDVVDEVRAFFEERLATAVASGVDPEQIVLDPGIGFGKRLEHNLALMANLRVFHGLGRPLLLGVSRKRWLGEITGRDVSDRLAASLGGFAACVERGAQIMRVHDVSSSCDVARILDRIHEIKSR